MMKEEPPDVKNNPDDYWRYRCYCIPREPNCLKEELNMADERKVEVHKEKKSDNGLVGATLIKYTAYVIIFIGIIWFLINYILPMF